MLPALTHEFGLLPWHFGGDGYLTYAEAQAYLETFQAMAEERKRISRQAGTNGARSHPRPRARRRR
jgi:hypothetical protein